MSSDASVVLVAPIVPAASGNGLAMRAGMFLDALSAAVPVHLVVVPVAGGSRDDPWARARAHSIAVVEPPTGEAAKEHTTRQLADADLRERLARTAPLPASATLVPPTLAETVAAALPADVGPPAAVLALRLYLAPLGIRVATLLGAARILVDADDDDVALLHSLGDHDQADAFDRLARVWLPSADDVLAAAPLDASTIAARVGLPGVHVISNAVAVPAAVPPPPGAERLLFVGNLTYEPNRVAARMLAEEVLPALRTRRPTATVDLVGPQDGSLDALGRVTGVRLTGAVPDVAPYYARADVVVVPLRHGAGSRIKVLEAFAYRRPVVATRTALAGLDIDPAAAVVAESAAELAGAADELLGDRARAAAQVERAAVLVSDRYSHAAVAPLVRAVVLG